MWSGLVPSQNMYTYNIMYYDGLMKGVYLLINLCADKNDKSFWGWHPVT